MLSAVAVATHLCVCVNDWMFARECDFSVRLSKVNMVFCCGGGLATEHCKQNTLIVNCCARYERQEGGGVETMLTVIQAVEELAVTTK